MDITSPPVNKHYHLEESAGRVRTYNVHVNVNIYYANESSRVNANSTLVNDVMLPVGYWHGSV